MTKLRSTLALLLVQGLSLESVQREDGQTLAEYALILAFVAIGVIIAVVALRGSITGLFNTVSSNI
jgi:Flp pilus assembly pilin Flp